MYAKLAHLIASGLYSGLSPKAPGTVGSIFCLIFWLLFVPKMQHFGFTLICLSVTVLLGFFAITHCLSLTPTQEKERKDPQWIVIDEWAGLLVALLPANPSSLLEPVLAFALFRVLDIKKPGPIGLVENLPGAQGILADDLLAGLLAACILLFAQSALPL